jgi:hypothetical protein
MMVVIAMTMLVSVVMGADAPSVKLDAQVVVSSPSGGDDVTFLLSKLVAAKLGATIWLPDGRMVLAPGSMFESTSNAMELYLIECGMADRPEDVVWRGPMVGMGFRLELNRYCTNIIDSGLRVVRQPGYQPVAMSFGVTSAWDSKILGVLFRIPGATWNYDGKERVFVTSKVPSDPDCFFVSLKGDSEKGYQGVLGCEVTMVSSLLGIQRIAPDHCNTSPFEGNCKKMSSLLELGPGGHTTHKSTLYTNVTVSPNGTQTITLSHILWTPVGGV